MVQKTKFNQKELIMDKILYVLLWSIKEMSFLVSYFISWSIPLLPRLDL